MDRQDFDALLMGAVYGELTPAEQAALAAHFESHPGDRKTLDELTAARSTVRERLSLADASDVEPPQAVSALLLQEAARRAPRASSARATARGDEGEGWFARLRRSFMAHPAVAAIATLVLVVGVAGSMYLRTGSLGYTERVADNARNEAPQAPAAAAAPGAAAVADPSAAVANTRTGKAGLEGDLGSAHATGGAAAADGYELDRGVAAGSGAVTTTTAEYQVGLADKLDAQKQLAQPAIASAPAAAPPSKNAVGFAHGASGGAASNRYVVVNGQSPAIKEDGDPVDHERELAKDSKDSGGKLKKGERAADLDESLTTGADDRAYARATGALSNGPGAPAPQAAPTTPAPVAAPPPADSSPVNAKAMRTAKPSAPAPTPTQNDQSGAAPPASPAPPPPPPTAAAQTARKQDAAVSWARDQHARLSAAVTAGNCTDAASIALSIATTAPDYYAQNVANDRAVKPCLAYINQARDRESRARKAAAAPAATDR